MAKQAKDKKHKSIEEALWDSANKLRGSVEPSEYKHVVLGLIFLKFASDKFEERKAELIAEGKVKYLDMVEFYTSKNVFYLPQVSRWSYLIDNAKQDDIAIKIDTALFTVEKNNPALKGALPDNYYSRMNLDVSKLASLLDTINNIDTLRDKQQDIVGRVYEYFLSKFALAEGKGKGEFYTPKSIVNLIAEMLEPYKGKIYDPACGSGGMLTEAEHFALEINPKATFHLYGQEVNPETFAICKADMLIKEEDPDKIAFGSTLSNDGFSNLQFDFMLSNPPYGKTWKIDQPAIVDKKEIIDHRFKIGVPRVNDGQLLFLMNMVSKMKKDSELGSRFATIHNGSALFTGDAGQGESEIRKYLFENDLLEAIIALPNDLFYNTGIPTYIFILTNKKDKKRKGKLQLINVTADHFNSKMRKPLGKKRVQFDANHINTITKLFLDYVPNEYSIILDNTDFGYHQITVHQPEKDKQGNIVLDSKGKPKSDAKLRDIENIPLKDSIDDFFETEVLPFVPNAWYNAKETKVGYEVNFAKYFYQYQAPRKLTEITKDILAIEEETENLLKEIIEA